MYKHTCHEVCESQSIISLCVEAVFFSFVFSCVSSLSQSKHTEAHGDGGKKTAIGKCQRSGWPKKGETGQNINQK